MILLRSNMRGRPIYSIVRQNIIEILYFLKKGYGYEIYRIYLDLFPKVTRRLIYYHLNKGVKLNELKIEKIESEAGNYSWGGTAEKIYYSLSEKAKPTMEKKVKEYFEQKKA